MNKLEKSTWGHFVVGEEFECSTTSALKAKDIKDGEIPYITRTGTNNGLDKFVEDGVKNLGNCITIGAEGTVAFYQEDDFIAGVKVYTIRHEKMNKKNGLFLATILNLDKYKYSYNRARILDKIKEEIISLPQTPEGEIDWQAMEAIMESLESEAKTREDKIIKLAKNDPNTIRTLVDRIDSKNFNDWAGNTDKEYQKIETKHWQPFYMDDLFEITTGGDILPTDEEEGDIPVICLGFENNGYSMKIKNNPKHPLYDSGCITVSGWAGGLKAFYQPEDFYVKGRLKVCKPKFNMNSRIALFICTVINLQSYKFSYGRKSSGEKFSRMTINLPIMKNENDKPLIDDSKKYSKEGYIPDFSFMENFINSLPYSEKV